MGLILPEFATSLKLPKKKDTAKTKPYYTSSLRVLEIAKIGLSENLTRLPSGIFAKISPTRKIPVIRYLKFEKFCFYLYHCQGASILDNT